jgi:hypothetical protein
MRCCGSGRHGKWLSSVCWRDWKLHLVEPKKRSRQLRVSHKWSTLYENGLVIKRGLWLFGLGVLRECLSQVYPEKDKKPIRIKKKTIPQEQPKTNTGETWNYLFTLCITNGLNLLGGYSMTIVLFQRVRFSHQLFVSCKSNFCCSSLKISINSCTALTKEPPYHCLLFLR